MEYSRGPGAWRPRGALGQPDQRGIRGRPEQDQPRGADQDARPPRMAPTSVSRRLAYCPSRSLNASSDGSRFNSVRKGRPRPGPSIEPRAAHR